MGQGNGVLSQASGLIGASIPTKGGQLAFRCELGYIALMTKVLEDAIDKLRKLPEDRQAYVAEVLEQIASAGGDIFVVPDEHRASVLEGLEQAGRGEFVSDHEMAVLWKKCGL